MLLIEMEKVVCGEVLEEKIKSSVLDVIYMISLLNSSSRDFKEIVGWKILSLG